MVKTTTNIIEFQDNGIVVSKLNTKSGLKDVYILEQARSIGHSLHGEKAPILFDLTKLEKASVEEISHLFANSNYEVTKAMAVLINSNIQRMLINGWIIIKSFKIPCPVQVFCSKSEAEAWLMKFIEAKVA